MQNVISKLGNYEALLIVRYNAVNIYPLPTIPLSIGGHRGYVSHQKLKRHFRHNLNERFFTAFSYLRVYSLPLTQSFFGRRYAKRRNDYC